MKLPAGPLLSQEAFPRGLDLVAVAGRVRYSMVAGALEGLLTAEAAEPVPYDGGLMRVEVALDELHEAMHETGAHIGSASFPFSPSRPGVVANPLEQIRCWLIGLLWVALATTWRASVCCALATLWTAVAEPAGVKMHAAAGLPRLLDFESLAWPSLEALVATVAAGLLEYVDRILDSERQTNAWKPVSWSGGVLYANCVIDLFALVSVGCNAPPCQAACRWSVRKHALERQL
jgi:hypothetical protein